MERNGVGCDSQAVAVTVGKEERKDSASHKVLRIFPLDTCTHSLYLLRLSWRQLVFFQTLRKLGVSTVCFR